MTQTAFESIDVVAIQMVRERTFLYNGNRIITPEMAAEAFCALICNPDREYFVAMLMDGKNRITAVNIVSVGKLNQSIVHPRETFKAAILSNAAAVILAHNHPTGDLTPNREGLEITRRLKEGGELLGVRVLDHVIVDTETGRNLSFVSAAIL